MQMTNDEIIVSYRDAADKEKQVRILADLNMCDTSTIMKILKEAGAVAPGFDGRKVPKAKQKPEDEKAKIPEDIAVKAKLDRLELLLNTAENENRKLEEANKRLREKLDELETKNTELKKQNDDTTGSLENLQQKVREMDDRIVQLRGAIELKTESNLQYERFILKSIATGALDMEL